MIKKLFSVSVVFALFVSIAQAQTPQELKKIVANYDASDSALLIEKITTDAKQQLDAAKLIADQRGLPYRYVDERGEPVVLTGLDASGELVYITTDNFTGARTISAHNLYSGGSQVSIFKAKVLMQVFGMVAMLDKRMWLLQEELSMGSLTKQQVAMVHTSEEL